MTNLPTIKEFLKSNQLDQYHDAFIKTGATEQDLELVIQLNEQELSEFISALGMLPFHSIKFKKSLRELRNKLSPDKQEIISTENDPSIDMIAIQARIYGKGQDRSLTSYEKAINKAAAQLALEDPLLLSRKGELFKLAKKKLLDEGYQYKRGRSRSKLIKENPQLLQRQSSLLDKRQENAERISIQRQEKIRCLEKQIDELLRIRQLTENRLEINYYDVETRPSMETKLMQYEEEKRQLSRQISKLKSQERKHQWYYRRKSEKSGGSSSSDSSQSIEFSSQPSLSYNSSSNEEESLLDIEDRSFSIYSIETHYNTRESDVRARSLGPT
ncbi:hypothetical protein CU097_008391 [Rhizopus azygosporus]|uniref:NAB co-repressor domain-containing protein n=1 Tax=Rhizopus azygosporus TaxID=86630 RepID=A0A367K9J7_RHIAZ|nr:hypothetical protein CU097_008391 [Rhizopus azygosporus]